VELWEAWSWLAAAVAAELLGTTALRWSAVPGRAAAAGLTVVAYAASYGMFARAIEVIALGVAYAVWAGGGTAAMAVIGTRLFGEELDRRAMSAIALVVCGVVLLQAGPGA